MKDFFDWLLGGPDLPCERRRSSRYPAVPNWAFLSWREGARTRVSPARILNLSTMGAVVLADEAPLLGAAAWLRLDEPVPTGWVKANIVRRARARKVGLDFAEHCPYDVFKAAIQPAERVVSVSPEHADGYWR